MKTIVIDAVRDFAKFARDHDIRQMSGQDVHHWAQSWYYTNAREKFDGVKDNISKEIDVMNSATENINKSLDQFRKAQAIYDEVTTLQKKQLIDQIGALKEMISVQKSENKLLTWSLFLSIAINVAFMIYIIYYT